MLAYNYEGAVLEFYFAAQTQNRALGFRAACSSTPFVGFLILPPIIRSVAVKQLSKQLDREVSIQQVKLNPFALSATVRGLLIKDKDGEPFVSWDEVYVNFQLSSFFGKAWVFKEISTTRPFVRVQMNQDGTFNFSDLIAKFSTNAPPPRQSRKPSRWRCTLAGCTSAARRRRWRISRRASRSSAPSARWTSRWTISAPTRTTKIPTRSPARRTRANRFRGAAIFTSTRCARQGELKLFNFTLNKYAPLYQDLVRFRDPRRLHRAGREIPVWS